MKSQDLECGKDSVKMSLDLGYFLDIISNEYWVPWIIR